MTTLADDLAQLLDGELSGFSCNTLALLLRRRRSDVLAELQTDPRFERTGEGRGSRWRTTPHVPLSTPWGGMGRKDRWRPDLDPSGIPTLPRRAARG